MKTVLGFLVSLLTATTAWAQPQPQIVNALEVRLGATGVTSKETSGIGTPEGSVVGAPGARYVDVTNGTRYRKAAGSGTDATGWVLDSAACSDADVQLNVGGGFGCDSATFTYDVGTHLLKVNNISPQVGEHLSVIGAESTFATPRDVIIKTGSTISTGLAGALRLGVGPLPVTYAIYGDGDGMTAIFIGPEGDPPITGATTSGNGIGIKMWSGAGQDNNATALGNGTAGPGGDWIDTLGRGGDVDSVVGNTRIAGDAANRYFLGGRGGNAAVGGGGTANVGGKGSSFNFDMGDGGTGDTPGAKGDFIITAGTVDRFAIIGATGEVSICGDPGTTGKVLTANTGACASWETPSVAVGSITGLGTGVATWLATPSSANLRTAVTDETGTGVLVFGTAPTFTTSITTPLILGGTANNDDITIRGTSSATKTTSYVLLQDDGGLVGIGTTTPGYKLHVAGTSATDVITADIGVNLNRVTNPASGSVALIASAGNVNAGQHYYAVTYTTAIGETNAFTIGNVTTDAGNGRVTVTIPVSSDYRVTGRKIYRTKVGGSSFQNYLLTTIANNSATTYVDNVADASLTGVEASAAFQINTTNSNITVGGAKVMVADLNGTHFGLLTAPNLLGGGSNSLFGYRAGASMTAANQNAVFGDSAGAACTTCGSSVFVGTQSGNAVTTAVSDVFVGRNAGINHNGASNYNTIIGAFSFNLGTPSVKSANTAIGYGTGQNNTGSNGIYLGYTAGYYETASAKLIIDSFTRANEAGGRTDAIIYGVLNATAANQILALGGGGKVGIGTIAPASLFEVSGGLTTTGAVVTLGTKEPTVVANDVLGRINFYAPLEGAGGDANLVGASIVARAEATFSSSVNSTSLLFQTGASETATTKMTLTPTGDLKFLADVVTFSGTAPTVSSGFGTSPSISANGTLAFTINVGTGGTATGGVFAMPTVSNGWNCQVENQTAVAANRADQRTVQTASSTTTVTIQNQTVSTGAALAWTASDVIRLSCIGR